MSGRFLMLGMVSVTLALTGCAAEPQPTATPTQSASQSPTVDPTLIPTASPTAIVEADPALYQTGMGEYLFKVGEGPAWCTISPDSAEVICEISEAAAQYQPLPVPETCDFSYGYQISLKATKPDNRDYAAFLCASGYYSDPSGAQVLPSGQGITVADFSCFVLDDTARCETAEGKYIVLGAKAWALGN